MIIARAKNIFNTKKATKSINKDTKMYEENEKHRKKIRNHRILFFL